MKRDLTEYELEEMCKYGPCVICDGPRTCYLTVEITDSGHYPPRREDINIVTAGRCLWCGTNPDDVEFVPRAEVDVSS